MKDFGLIKSAKRTALIQLFVSIAAFVFAVIIIGIGAALCNGKTFSSGSWTALTIFSMFEFGVCVGIASIWVFIYFKLSSINEVKKLLIIILATFGAAALYIYIVMIINVVWTAELFESLEYSGWKALNSIVVVFSGLGLAFAIITYLKVNKTSKKLEALKARFENAGAPQTPQAPQTPEAPKVA